MNSNVADKSAKGVKKKQGHGNIEQSTDILAASNNALKSRIDD